jgi:hypothetical protein
MFKVECKSAYYVQNLTKLGGVLGRQITEMWLSVGYMELYADRYLNCCRLLVTLSCL